MELGHFEHSRQKKLTTAHEKVRYDIKIMFLDAGSGFLQIIFTDILNIPGAAALHALMPDPLTASVCCPAEIKTMFERLFESQRSLLHPDWH